MVNQEYNSDAYLDGLVEALEDDFKNSALVSREGSSVSVVDNDSGIKTIVAVGQGEVTYSTTSPYIQAKNVVKVMDMRVIYPIVVSIIHQSFDGNQRGIF